MEHKILPAMVMGTDEAEGIVECIFAVFGNVDEGNDIIHPGAFTKTFQERRKKVLILDQHKTDSIMRALGIPIALQEVSIAQLPPELTAQYPEATGGAKATIQFLMKTPEGAGAFERIKTGAINEWSFGYDAIQHEPGKIGDRRVRHLRELKLYELGPVLWGMNTATTTVSAKGAADNEPEADKDIKRIIPYQDIPLASRTRAWRASAARTRVRDWAGFDPDDEDAMNWSQFRRAFMWYDADEPEMLGSYKLPYADVVNGELVAIPRGIFAVAGVLEGARGGIDLSEAEQTRIRTLVSRWYGRMQEEFDDEELVPPWEKSLPAVFIRDETKAVNLTAYVRSVVSAFYADYPDVFGNDREDNRRLIYYCEEVYDTFVVIRQEGNQEGNGLWRVDYEVGEDGITFAAREDWVMGHRPFVPLQATTLFQTSGKTGRVLSLANANRLTQAVAVINEILNEAGYLEPANEDEQGETSAGAGPQDAPTSRQADADASPTLLQAIEIERAEIEYALVD